MKARVVPLAVLTGRAVGRSPLVPVAILVAILVAGSGASAATQAPSFVRTDYFQLGNNHLVADLNGDGRPDLAGIGAQSAAVLLANGDGTFGRGLSTR